MTYASASVLVALLGVSAAASPAEHSACTDSESLIAESVVEYLDSWKNVYLAFRDLSQCDDGGVAEGFSEAIVHLLAHDWHHLSQLEKLIHANQEFEGFVLSHVDATTNQDDLLAVEHSAESLCLPRSKALCMKLSAASKKALLELKDAI